MSKASDLACPVSRCRRAVTRHFDADTLPGARVDAVAEDVPIESRLRDGSAKWNAGLPGIETVVGTNPNGTPKKAYRPISNAEVGSNRNCREIAKRSGVTPVDTSGRYRSLPR
jgi:hypothetical protein